MDNSINMNDLKPIARPLLPVFFILSTPGHMMGESIDRLNHTMKNIVETIADFAASNADSLIKIGVLQVHTGVHWMQPEGLEPLEHFIYDNLEADGLNDLGAALTELDSKLSTKSFLVSTTGLCNPLFFFITFGSSTDDWDEPLKRIKTNAWFKHALKIGCSIGSDSDNELLFNIVDDAENVVQIEDCSTLVNKDLKKIVVDNIMKVSNPCSQIFNGKDIVLS